MSPHPKDDVWTRDESRWIDGELEADAARRHEARRSSERDRRLRTYREAMNLWRDDTGQATAQVDMEALAHRVLDGSAVVPAPAGKDVASRVARRYAAAALVLIGLGLAGAVCVGSNPTRINPPPPRADIRGVEQDRLALLAEREWESFRPAPGRTFEEER